MNFSTSTDITSYQTSIAPMQPSNQCNVINTSSQLGALGLFLFFLMIGCFWLKGWHQKRSEQQTNVHHQQVEILERIWSMKTRQEP